MKQILILAVVMLLSFPVLFFGILLFTGNARLQLGPEKKPVAEETKVEVIKQTVESESLATANSKTFQAIQQERRDVASEREKLQDTRQRLEMFQRDLESQKAELKKERERIESLVSRSDSLEKKKTAQLAKVYSAMRPAEAAQIIATLPDDFAAKIVAAISDDRQKAKILAAIPPEKATRMTEILGGTKRAKR